MKKRGEGEGAC